VQQQQQQQQQELNGEERLKKLANDADGCRPTIWIAFLSALALLSAKTICLVVLIVCLH
jgi:hypothetical protein